MAYTKRDFEAGKKAYNGTDWRKSARAVAKANQSFRVGSFDSFFSKQWSEIKKLMPGKRGRKLRSNTMAERADPRPERKWMKVSLGKLGTLGRAENAPTKPRGSAAAPAAGSSGGGQRGSAASPGGGSGRDS